MGQRVGWHRDKSAARKQLLVELAQFVYLKKARVTVIFDGMPENNIADGASYRGVKVHYAGPHADADSRIIAMVEQATNRQPIVVVTSDGQLTRRVRACGVRVLRAGVFRRLLENLAPDAGGNEHQPHIQPDELSDWMRYFGVDETDAEH